MPVNNLNLLPPDLALSKDLNKLLKTSRALGVIGIAAFLIFGIGVGTFFIFTTLSLNGINANITSLTGQVSAQQKSEQQIILIKDRLAKIASIQNLPNSLSAQKAIEPFLTDLSMDSPVKELSIDPTNVRLSVDIKTNSGLSAFLSSFQSSDIFKTVNLVTFSLNPSSGYSIEISAVKK